MKKAIICGGFFDAKAEKMLKDKVIIISGDKIEDVTDKASFAAADNYEVIDLSGRYVLPGLIDCHTHVAFYPGEYPNRLPGKSAINGVVNAKLDLLAGFTTLRDMAGAHFCDVAVRDAINSGEVWGPRMLVSGPGIVPTFGHGDHHFKYFVTGIQLGSSMVADGPDEVRKTARLIAKMQVNHMKIYVGGGVGSIGDMPDVTKFTEAEIRAAVEVAEAENLISGAHVYGADGIIKSVRAGVNSIEHGTMMDEEAIDVMVDAGTYLVPTLAVLYGKFDQDPALFRPESLVKARLVTANHGEMFPLALKRGVKIAFGSDAIGAEGSMHGTQGREFHFMVRHGMTAEMALRSATTNAAKLIRMDDKVGTIEAGKLADIIALTENPIEDITTLERVDFVMKDGVVYKEKGLALRRLD